MRFDGQNWCCDRIESGVPIVVCSTCGLFTFQGLPHASRVTGPVGGRTNNPWKVSQTGALRLEGITAERARVVRWLRKRAESGSDNLYSAAAMIEAGKHEAER